MSRNNLILEGKTLYRDGKEVGPFQLEEGQKSEVMTLIESFPGSWCDLKEVELNKTEETKIREITEASGKTPQKILTVLEGRFQMVDTKNNNGRIYPRKIWEDILKEGGAHHQRMSNGTVLGEVDHPCFTSNDFRVLTSDGWKNFDEIHIGDLVWSRVNGLATLSRVTAVINQPYSGPAYNVVSKSLRCGFTPQHKFLLEDRYGNEEYCSLEEIANDRVGFGHHGIPKTADWGHQEPTLFFTIPGVSAGRCKNDVSRDLLIDARLFAGFLGIWLAEGHVSSDSCDNYGVFISQKTPWSRKYIFENILSKFPEELKWTEQKIGFYLSDARLHAYLRNLGNKYTKYIPEDVKNLDSECLGELIHWFNVGDGRTLSSGEGNYKRVFCESGNTGTKARVRRSVFSVSERLVRDLLECQIRSGGCGSLTKTLPIKDRKLGNRTILAKNRKTLHQLNISRIRSISLDPRFMKIDRVEHSGNIYCLRTEHGNFYAETGGKCFWTGNCDGQTFLSRVAVMTTGLRINESNPKEILGRMVVFDNSRGRDLKAIIDGGGKVGVSSRGSGSLLRMEGADVVQGDYKFDTFDVVHNPSTHGAFPNEVTETTSGPIMTESTKVIEASANVDDDPEWARELRKMAHTKKDTLVSRAKKHHGIKDHETEEYLKGYHQGLDHREAGKYRAKATEPNHPPFQKGYGDAGWGKIVYESLSEGYHDWPHAGWWSTKEEIAKGMKDHELVYAHKDSVDAARANPENEGKYHDEASVYHRELRRRKSPDVKESEKKTPDNDSLQEGVLTEPSTFVSKYPEGEAKWKKAKEVIAREHPGLKVKDSNRYYSMVTGAFKKMVGEAVERPSTIEEVEKILESISVSIGDSLPDIVRSLHTGYRSKVSAVGPLRTHELKAVHRFAGKLLESEAELKKNTPAINVIATYISESGDLVVRNTVYSEADVRAKINEIRSSTKGAVIIEVDRSNVHRTSHEETVQRLTESNKASVGKFEKRINEKKIELQETTKQLSAAKDLLTEAAEEIRRSEKEIISLKEVITEKSTEFDKLKDSIPDTILEKVKSVLLSTPEYACMESVFDSVDTLDTLVESIRTYNEVSEQVFREPTNDYEKKKMEILETRNKSEGNGGSSARGRKSNMVSFTNQLVERLSGK